MINPIILLTPDGLKAYAMIPQIQGSEYPTARQILEALQRRGIVFGIDAKVLQRMADERVTAQRVEVARGIAPKPGNPGHIECLVDLGDAGKPKELADGRVDHRNLQLVVNVKKGQPLARHVPPEEGMAGKSVFGKPIPPPLVADVTLRSGVGTEIAADNPDLLIASIDGGLSVDIQGIMEVRNKRIVKSDIDYSTGNVSFAGDLHIGGSVRAGFSVHATGSVIITGRVEDSKVTCGANLEIMGGAVGSGNGILECKGSLTARHLENFVARAGGNVVISEDVVHSTINAGGLITAKSIVGGTACAADGVEAESIGNSAETRTIIDLGRKYAVIQERYILLKKLGHLTGEMAGMKDQMFVLVRDSMSEKGVMSAEDEKKLDSLKQTRVECYKTCTEMQVKLEELEKIITRQIDPVVTARNIFPNSLIKFGAADRLIMEPLHNVKITPSEGRRLTDPAPVAENRP